MPCHDAEVILVGESLVSCSMPSQALDLFFQRSDTHSGIDSDSSHQVASTCASARASPCSRQIEMTRRA